MSSSFGCIALQNIHSEQIELRKMQYEFQELIQKSMQNNNAIVTKYKEQIKLKREKINTLTKDYLLTCSW
jgi:hypothetical protein